MQIKGLHKNIYKLSNYALSQEKCDQQRKKLENPVRQWEKLKRQDVDIQTCQEFCGISRSTYYRYKKSLAMLAKGQPLPTKRPKTLRKPLWGESEVQMVLHLRRVNPTYGKAKIAVILRRDHGSKISESTVGRILKVLLTKGLITKSISAPRMRRKRQFKGHAKHWSYNLKPSQPGQMIQVDHMSVTKNGIHVKHFQAWDPTSKYIHANLYYRATSLCASKFLKELIDKTPFTIQSIQVDGGSEFMKEFEKKCQEQGIDLYVLPPRRPQYNGGVERGNRTFREEFYANRNLLADSQGALRAELTKAINKYNSYRPHFSLKGLTPLDYIRSIQEAA